MTPFVYHRPATIAEASELLAQEGARVLAGGTDLVPQLREGRRSAQHLVDLKWIEEATTIRHETDAGLSLGAAAAAAEIGRHTAILTHYPVLATAARLIGSVQVQSRATFGGNIANAAPSADAVPALIVLEARVRVANRLGERRIALADLFTGPGRTTLTRGDLVVAIEVPTPAERSAAHYVRFTPRREMDIAIVGAAAAVACGADGGITSARLGLASVAPTPLRARGAERLLVGRTLDDEAIAAASSAAALEARPISDTRGSADYRRHLVGVLVERALRSCREQLAREGGR